MLAALDDPALDDEDRVLLHFAIGKLLGRSGRLRGGDAAFRSGQPDLAAGTTISTARAFSADVDRLMRRFTPGLLCREHRFRAGRRGAAVHRRSAALGHNLGRADHLQPPAGSRRWRTAVLGQTRQPVGNCRGDLSLAPKRRTTLSGEYLAQLRRIGPTAARITDKQPFNLLCLGVIHLLLPKARIIQCRRHPVDTCLSIYFTNFKQVDRLRHRQG